MVTELFIIPCGRTKLDRPVPARHLYNGHHFQFVLGGVERAADGRPVRILSARHGLVAPETVVAPYDTTMTDRDSIPAARLTEQLAALPGTELLTIHAYLPRAYRARLVDAVTDLMRPCEVRDGYADCRRIGEQRRVIATLVGHS